MKSPRIRRAPRTRISAVVSWRRRSTREMGIRFDRQVRTNATSTTAATKTPRRNSLVPVSLESPEKKSDNRITPAIHQSTLPVITSCPKRDPS